MDRLPLKRLPAAVQPGHAVCRVMALLMFAALLGGGCATTNADPDIPWNTPQPWETAPTIPGFNR